MKNKNNIIQQKVEPIPESFASVEEAAKFWDTHSTADYEEYLEPVNLEIEIQERHYQIEVDQKTFVALNHFAQKTHQSVKNIASDMLDKQLELAM